jgi:hypothetical protein
MFGKKKKKAWVVAVDMGYGHQRAALPLQSIAERGEVLTANTYYGIPDSDSRVWEDSRRFYEIVSRFKKFPVLGDFVFAIFDKFQEIKKFYPSTESIDTPSLQLKQIYRLIKEKGWGKHLVETLNKNPLPLVTTFFIPAFMAEHWGYTGKIYVVIPDTDVSRAWAPLQPAKSNIVYCASTAQAAVRLARYGVKEENIVQTGFPLPEEFTKNNAARVKKDLRRRLQVLDPKREYLAKYKDLVERHVGKIPKVQKKQHVNITFAIGGAGAQVEFAQHIMESMRKLLREKTIKLHLVAGIHKKLAISLKKSAEKLGLSHELGTYVVIHEAIDKEKYFQDFSSILSETDILWTKPSELVFYAGLGVPILVASPIGSQEDFNREWLLEIGAGVDQKDPAATHEWLPEFIEKGVFAKAAMQGFIEIPKDGAENIKKLVCG